MRAPWDASHFRSASAGLLAFSPDSASAHPAGDGKGAFYGSGQFLGTVTTYVPAILSCQACRSSSLQNPQAAEADDGDGEEAGDAAHEGVDEAQRRAVEADDPELADDAAEGRALPRPETDVIREHQEDERSRAVDPGGQRCRRR